MKSTCKILKIAIILIIISIVIIFSCDSRLKTVNYNITSDKISNPVTLAVIADLHSCLYGKNQSQLISAIDEHAPDAVLLVGDIFDDDYVNDNSRILIDSIVEKYRTYYVSGNHEWWSGKMYEHFDYLEKAGVVVLRGGSDVLDIGGNGIVISGTDDPEVNEYDTAYNKWHEQFDMITQSLNNGYYNILLEHRPENAQQYFNYDFDLVLSGHAHGGQLRIPFVLNGLYAPNQGFFPELAGGIYDFDNKKLVVSRGLSKENTVLPRVFNRPELVFVSIS